VPLQVRRFVASVLLVAGARVGAQSAATVPASSTIYDRLEGVSALYPVRGLFLGERALSRRELRRVVEVLRQVVDSAAPHARRQWARRELDIVESNLNNLKTIRPGVPVHAGTSWRSDIMSTDAIDERIEPNGQGQIDAITGPFMAGRHGWPTLKGATATIAPTIVAGLADGVALVVQPTASLTMMRDEGWISERLLQRAYARATYHNVAVQVGAEEHRWGQSPHGALFISGNALPLPMLSLGTDTAITLPWWFRRAGRVRLTTFISDLGPSQRPPHARLVGWQGSMQPWSRFELGVAVSTQTGGNGGPPATFLERVVDLFPIIDALAPQHADLLFSNKLAGGNLRLRFPELSGLDFYYELQIDDFDGRRLRSSLEDDAAHLLGLRLPIQIGDGQIASRVEWHKTSLRLYEHSQFTSGSTYRQHIIGSPLGPHAAAGYFSVAWRPTATRSIELTGADERRDPAIYNTVVSGPRDSSFRFVRVTDDPDYRRRRTVIAVDQVMPGGAFRFSVGYNRAWRTAQAGRDEWMGLISFTTQRLVAY
jgi:hypothetical protein